MEQHINKLKNSSIDYLIELARAQPVHTDIKTPKQFVRGCKNYIWVSTDPQSDNTFKFRFASSSYISLGMCVILGSHLDGLTAEQVGKVKFSDLRDFTVYLPLERQRGVQAVLNKIHQEVKQPVDKPSV